MSYGLLLGDDEKVAEWTYSKYRLYPVHVDKALGLISKDKVLVGAVLLQNYNGINIGLSYYGPWTLSVGIVRLIARIVTVEFNVARVTLVVPKKNKRLMRSVQRFGFRLEGTQRCFYGHRDCPRNTGVRFVMFRERLDKYAGLNKPILEQKQN